jgi:uncharacterized cupredoxin-like copper-binding protein
MSKFILSTIIIAAGVSPVFAGGTHTGGHAKKNDHHQMMAGMPGKVADVGKSIEILMKETDDGEMIFEPNSISTTVGETVRLIIKNVGELEHEFVLDDHKGIMAHKVKMEQADDEMGHKDPNSLRLDSGKEGSIVWKFKNKGNFEFACLIQGHYEAGMKGNVTVSLPAPALTN